MKKLKFLTAAQRANLALGAFLLIYGLMLIVSGIFVLPFFLDPSNSSLRFYADAGSIGWFFIIENGLSLAAGWIAGGLLLASFLRRLPGKTVSTAGLILIAYQLLCTLGELLVQHTFTLSTSGLLFGAIAAFGGYWRECYLREHPEIDPAPWFPFLREAQAQLAAAPDEDEEFIEENEDEH